MIQAEKFSPDIAIQVLSSLKGYASKIGYEGFCRFYQETYVNAALALDPVREDQHRKFKLVAKRFTDTLSSKTPIDDDEFDKVKKTLEKWNPTIDLPTVHTIGGAFSDAQSDFDFAHKDLRSKLQELLEAARTKSTTTI